MPGSLLSQYSLSNGGSVALSWVTWYCSGVSRATASGSLRYVSVMSAPSLIMAPAGCGPIRGSVALRWSPLFLCDSCLGMLAVGWEAFEVYGVWNPSRPPDSPALPRPSRAALGSWKIAFGNTWVIAAIVVKLPCCPSPVALPALFRLWRGKGTASQVQLAAELIEL